ncbi:hypothetical protein G3I40_44330, partial [Streptomyces sp. SID14478]|nr:hypothetical protein [Streptomyces sp. SID14478]
MPGATTTPPTSPSPARPTPWDDLVTTALLGTERRSSTPPGALLDETALQTVRRRAGLRPAPAATPPDPAATDPRP